MREAVIVSYARTGLAKSGRGGFNLTPTMTMAAHAISHAVAKSGVDHDGPSNNRPRTQAPRTMSG